MTWQQTMELKSKLETELKRKCMIYQYGEKLEACRAFGKPLSFFNREYVIWEKWRDKLHQKRKDAEEACAKAGIGNVRYCDFPLYRKLMGLDNSAIDDTV